MPIPKNHPRFQHYQDKVNAHYDVILQLYYDEDWSLMEICKRYDLPRNRTEKTLMERGYVLRGISSKTKRSIKKSKERCLERYGVDNISKLESHRRKKSERNSQNYNNAGHSEKQKWVLYVMGIQVHPNKQEVYNTYRDRVGRLTRGTKKKLSIPERCYYTNIPFELDRYNNDWYPSIDHKVSVLFGFLNDYSPKEIANENNLCYCARLTNSIKKQLTEKEFLLSGMVPKIREYYESQKCKTNT